MTLQQFEEENGILTPIEFSDLPFIPKRVFYVVNVPQGDIRGKHAHYETEQLLICIQGIIKVSLHDGKEWSHTILQPSQSIIVPKLVWDEQKYLTGKDVLLSLCSTPYNTADYINDFQEFLLFLSKLKYGKINE